jgi:hypothetical protein
MPKGLFTQSACVLLSQATSLDVIAPLLSEFQIVKRTDQPENQNMGGPGLVLAFRPEVNGYMTIDVRNRTWPDNMGDSKTDPMLFGAWSMGFWGPYAFPGNFQRAQQQLWAWPEGKEAAGRHAALIHINTSYSFGLPKDGPVIPKDYDSLSEIRFVTRVVLALLKHPDALAYFNANGEVLADENVLRKSLDYHDQHQLPPFEIWSNIRLFNPNNGWILMDTVGMEQLDRPDLEACFPAKRYDLGQVSDFLRNCCNYLLTKGEVIKDTDTMSGPGNINWRAHHVEKEIVAPPRRLIRWFPLDGSQPPPGMDVAAPKPSPGGLLGRLFKKG